MRASELKVGGLVRVVDDKPGSCPACGDMKGKSGEIVDANIPSANMAVVRWPGCPRGHVFVAVELEDDGAGG